MTEQTTKTVRENKKWSIAGIAIHLVGFALGFVGEGAILLGMLDINSGAASLEPIGDTLYGLGLVLVISVAARAGVPIKYLAAAGLAVGIGLFYKSAVHEIHMASGMGFGIPHPGHIGIGAILITLSAISLLVMTLASTRNKKVAGKI